MIINHYIGSERTAEQITSDNKIVADFISKRWQRLVEAVSTAKPRGPEEGSIRTWIAVGLGSLALAIAVPRLVENLPAEIEPHDGPYVTYVVESGDNLTQIAEVNRPEDRDVRDLIADIVFDNELKSQSDIRPNQVLRIRVDELPQQD